MELNQYVDQRIAENEAKLTDASAKNDEMANAKLAFYRSLKRVLEKKATMTDVGTMDAINDLLQQLGLVPASKTFYKM
ncbi:MAG: hypothetical protein JWP80_4285 [Pseudomonas sp.]|nr:hypothetical protein [Pseudomonas sp.]